MAEKFMPINVYENWCQYDQLGHRTLEGGEKVEVKWPDGSVTQQKVSVSRSAMKALDHGKETHIPISKAYILVEMNGAMLRVRLHDISNVLVRRV